MEASHLYTSDAPCNAPAFLSALTPLVAEYNHSKGFSVRGGFVYRSNLFPILPGKYIHPDYGASTIWSLRKNPVPPYFSTPVSELTSTGINISAYGEGEQGEVYLADLVGGTIRQVEDVSWLLPSLGT
jgi:hypothetical protein